MVHVLYHAAMRRSHTFIRSSLRISFARLGRFMKKPSVVIMTVLVVGVGVWLTVRQVQINQDRARFMQAKADLHVIAERIVTMVGQPDERQSADSCGYTSVVYGRGYRFCDVFERMAYSVPKVDIEDYIQRISDAVRSTDIVKSYRSPEGGDTDPEDVSYIFDLGNSLGCGIQILRVDPTAEYLRWGYKSFLGLSRDGVSLSLSCGGDAKAEYFSVK